MEIKQPEWKAKDIEFHSSPIRNAKEKLDFGRYYEVGKKDKEKIRKIHFPFSAFIKYEYFNHFMPLLSSSCSDYAIRAKLFYSSLFFDKNYKRRNRMKEVSADRSVGETGTC